MGTVDHGFAEVLPREEEEKEASTPPADIDAERKPQPGDDVTVLMLISGGQMVVLEERAAVRDRLIQAKRHAALADDDFLSFLTIEGEVPMISAAAIIGLGHGKVVEQPRQIPGREPVIAQPGDLQGLPPLGNG